MNPAEIEALLALSESARALLAAVPGPGWFVSRNLDGSDAKATPLGERYIDEFCASVVRNGRAWAWCPDTFAIVQACGSGARLRERDSGFGFEASKGPPLFLINAATPRLAALRLLAAVSS